MNVNLAPGQIDISKAPNLAALQNELAVATERYAHAEREGLKARSAASAARNDLNATQKKLAEAFKVLRATAPPETDWGTERRSQEPCNGV